MEFPRSPVWGQSEPSVSSRAPSEMVSVARMPGANTHTRGAMDARPLCCMKPPATLILNKHFPQNTHTRSTRSVCTRRRDV
jgi:hypothetical protein